MEILIETVTNKTHEAAASYVRREVFGDEWGLKLSALPGLRSEALHLVARVQPGGQPIATLSVVDTTANDHLHKKYGLNFDWTVPVARYTQLAVIKPYRGMNIPLRMMLEAHRRFVAPGRFRHTWLLFHARRAAQGSFCRLMGFSASSRVFQAEHGPSCVLTREEGIPQSEQANRATQEYLDSLRSHSLNAVSPIQNGNENGQEERRRYDSFVRSLSVGPEFAGALAENEWLAH